MIQFLKEATLLFACFGIGVYYYGRLNFFFRIILVQVGIAVLSLFTARGVQYYQELYKLPLTNHWVYNIYIVCETLLLLAACGSWFGSKKPRILIFLAAVIFLITWVYYVWMEGIHRFANNAMVAEGIAMTICFLNIVNQSIQAEDFSWRRSGEIWASLGIVIYFSCNVPFIGSLHYLFEHYPKTTVLLFHFITDILGNIRYLFVAIGFYVYARKYSIPITAKS